LELQLVEQDIMSNLHWDLETIENQEYGELMKIMNASENDRLQTPDEIMKEYMAAL
jgi:hypothetical protein